jgi:hypothetical protein
MHCWMMSIPTAGLSRIHILRGYQSEGKGILFMYKTPFSPDW